MIVRQTAVTHMATQDRTEDAVEVVSTGFRGNFAKIQNPYDSVEPNNVGAESKNLMALRKSK